MSVKTTRRISRQRALEILLSEAPNLPNDTLADLLDRLADSRQSHIISQFDNFIVTEFTDENEE